MTIEIRADVPISIHPNVLSLHAAALEHKPGALATAQAALQNAYGWLGAVNDAEQALSALAASEAPAKRRQLPSGRSEYLGDLRLTSNGLRQFSGQEEELAEAAGVHMQRVTKKIDFARTNLEETASTLNKAVAFALTDPDGASPTGIALAGEIRAHTKSLPKNDRFGFLQDAIHNGDLPTVAAVLQGAPFLSGLTVEEQGNARSIAAEKFARQTVTEHAAVSKLIEAVELAGQEVLKRFQKVQIGADTPRAKANRQLAALKRGAA